MITRVLLAALKAVVGFVSAIGAEGLVNLPPWADALIVAASVYIVPNVGYSGPRSVGGNVTRG